MSIVRVGMAEDGKFADGYDAIFSKSKRKPTAKPLPTVEIVDLKVHQTGDGLFSSPLTNRREDEFGGSGENRMRYPLEVFDAVRAAWPENKPLAVALNHGTAGASAAGIAHCGIAVDAELRPATILT